MKKLAGGKRVHLCHAVAMVGSLLQQRSVRVTAYRQVSQLKRLKCVSENRSHRCIAQVVVHNPRIPENRCQR